MDVQSDLSHTSDGGSEPFEQSWAGTGSTSPSTGLALKSPGSSSAGFKSAAKHRTPKRFSESGDPATQWSPSPLTEASTAALPASETVPYSYPGRPAVSQGVSAASTTTDLDGGSFDNLQQLGDSLTSLREDSDGKRSMLVEEKTERASLLMDDETHHLVSGRQAGAGWELSGYVTSLPCLTRQMLYSKHLTNATYSIRWAPLNLPLKRRLQTVVVLFHTLSIVLFLTLFFLLCAIPLAWPLLLPYIVHLLFSNAHSSGRLTRRSSFLRSLKLWSLFGSYFPARLHRTEPLPPTRKYILGYHPHGIISHGAFAAFATEALGFAQLFPGITNTLLTLDANFRVPFYRDYALAMGLASVGRTSCQNLLSRGGANGEGMGRAITIVVGGAAESLAARPGTMRLVLRKRLGFVKLAVRAGADLVPVLAFGENELYDVLDAGRLPVVHGAQLLIKKALGWTVPLFHARGVFNYDVGLMPYRRPLNVVVGRRIEVEQKDRPEPEEVERLHRLYEAELRRIWEEWRGVFAPGMKGNMELME